MNGVRLSARMKVTLKTIKKETELLRARSYVYRFTTFHRTFYSSFILPPLNKILHDNLSIPLF